MKTLLFASIALALAACSGGGKTAAISARESVITFPPAGAVTDRSSVRVFGSTRGPVAAASVTVNGVAATSIDGFLTFEAVVELQPGPNQLVVGLTDVKGLHRSDAPAIAVSRVGAILLRPDSVAADAGASWFVADLGRPAVLRVDTANGMSSVVSDEDTGQGPPIGTPSDLVHDLGAQKLYLADAQFARVLEIDPITGDRRILSDTTHASRVGLAGIFAGVSALVLDPANDRLLAAAAGSDAVFAVAISTGDVDLIAGGGNALPAFRRGTGLSMLEVEGIGLDEAGNRAIVVDSLADLLLAVDLGTGDRHLLSSNAMPSQPNGPDFAGPTDLALDATRRFAYVSDRGGDQAPASVIRVDLATGDRTTVSDPATGAGLALVAPGGIATDPHGDRLVLGDPQLGAIIGVDLAAAPGDRSRLAGALVGTGPRFDEPDTCDLDSARQRLLIVDPERGVLAAVDLGDGARTVLATFDPDAELLDVAVDEAGGRALVTDAAGPRIWAVDLANGSVAELPTAGAPLSGLFHIVVDRLSRRALISRAATATGPLTEILAVELAIVNPTPANPNVNLLSRSASPAVGSGPDLTRIEDLVIDADRNRLLLTNSTANELGQVLAVDLVTGNRSVVSDQGTGSGPGLEDIDGLALDGARSRALVLNEDGTVMLAIDLQTGVRTVVADEDTGEGPELLGAEALAVHGDLAVALDEAYRAVVTVELSGGNRVISSK